MDSGTETARKAGRPRESTLKKATSLWLRPAWVSILWRAVHRDPTCARALAVAGKHQGVGQRGT
eukprot:5102400-Prorocentrum_lima.AAC.1